MPTTKFTFTVEGGQAVTGTFEKIAATAEQTQQRVERASKASGAGFEALEAGAKNLKASIADLSAELGPLGASLGSLAEGGGLFGLVAAGAVGAAAAIAEMTHRAAEQVAELEHDAQRIGLHARALQEWKIAGEEVGVSADKMQTALQLFAKNLGLAEANTGPLQKTLSKLNPELLTQLKSTHDVGEALGIMQTAMEGETDATKRAAEAAAAFGRGYAELMPLLREGANEVAATKQRLGELGALVDEDQVAHAEELHKKWVEVGAVISGNVRAALLSHTDLLIKILDLTEKVVAKWGKIETGAPPQARIAEIKETLARGTIGGPGGRPLTGTEIDQLKEEQARLEQTILDQTAKDIGEYNDKFRKAGGVKAGEAEAFIKNLTAPGRKGAFTKEEAAGLYGNVIAESGGVPTAGAGTAHYGLMQWGGDRLKGLQTYARWAGANIDDLNTQMDYIDLEASGQDARFRAGKTEKPSYEKAKLVALGQLSQQFPLPTGVQPGSAEAFAFAYQQVVERPGAADTSLGKRMKAAAFAETQVSGIQDTAAWEKQQHALDEASKKAEEHQKKLDALGEKSKEVADSIKVFRDEEEQLASGTLPRDIDQTAKLQAAGEKLTAALVKQAHEAGGDEDAARRLGEEYTRESIAAATLKQSVEQAARAEKEHATAMKELATISAAVGKTQVDLQQAVALAERPLDKVGSKIAEVQKKWEDYGQTVTAELNRWQEWIDQHKGTEDVAAEQARLDKFKEESAAEIQVGESADEARVRQLEWADQLKSVFDTADTVITDTFQGWILGTQKVDDAFKSMGASILKSVLDAVVGMAKSGLLEILTGQPQQNFLLDLFRGGAQPGGGSGLLGWLFGAGGTAAKAIPAITETGAGFSPVGTAEATGAVPSFFGTSGTLGARGASSGISGLLGQYSSVIGMWASILASLGFGIYNAIGAAKAVKDVSLGTAQGPANAIKGLGIGGTVAGVAGGAVAGAAVGSIFPGIGTAIGAAVGAAVGGAISQAVTNAVSGAVTGATKQAIRTGESQEMLNRQVVAGVKSNILLDILAPHLLLEPSGGSPLSRLFTPDIERIFGKMLRQILGGGTGGIGGGFSTANVPVGSTSGFGLEQYRGLATEIARFIAESFGGGGAAFPGKRATIESSIVLGAAKQRMKETGEDASTVLAQEFVSAFGGSLMAAFRVAMGREKPVRDQQIQFAAQEFTKGTESFGFNFGAVGEAVSREGIVPGGKAVKASQKALGDAFNAALQNAADSSAFRKSVEKSVQDAFISGVSKALTSGPLGQVFASFFSISNKPGTRRRRAFRRAKRRGDTGAEIKILSDEFQADVADFAKIVNDPAFLKAISTFNDDLLKLQVAASAASGDVAGAADAIRSRLAPTLQRLSDITNLQEDIRSRAAIAIAGTGFAGAREQQAALTRARETAQQQFEAQFGGAGLAEFARMATTLTANPQLAAGFQLAAKEGTGAKSPEEIAGEQLTGPNQQALFDKLKAFAEARLQELEGELNLLHQLHDTLESARDAFKQLAQQAETALGTFDSQADALDKFQQAAKTGLQAYYGGGFSGDPKKANPELLAKFETALQAAISAISARLAFFEQASDTAKSLGENARAAIGGRTEEIKILNEHMADLPNQIAKATAGGAGSDVAFSKSLTLLNEAIQGEAQQLQFFKAASENFKDFAQQADVARRGTRGARDAFADVRSQITALLPAALGGGADAAAAIEKLEKLLPQAFSLSQQAFTGGRQRNAEAWLEQIAKELGFSSDTQADVATRQLETLQKNAETLKNSADGQSKDAREQLAALDVLAKASAVAAGAGLSTTDTLLLATTTELQTFVDQMQPVLSYLQTTATTTLHDDFAHLAALFGDNPSAPILQALNDIKAELPAGARAGGGAVEAGQTYLVGERGPELFRAPSAGEILPNVTTTHSTSVNYQISGPFVVFQNAPSSRAEADEFGRRTSDILERRLYSFMARQQATAKVI